MLDFTAFNKHSKHAFAKHQQLIKLALKGKHVACPQCKQSLNVQMDKTNLYLRCKNNCSDFVLQHGQQELTPK